MLKLTDCQLTFLELSIPRVIAEVSAFDGFESIEYSDLKTTAKKSREHLTGYRQAFNLNGYVWAMGYIYFSGGDRDLVHKDLRKKGKWLGMMDDFIIMCKDLGQFHTLRGTIGGWRQIDSSLSKTK